ncbi:hypothetical protein BKA08_003243 [Nocardioides marinisabuli]|uniref:GyrI-like small molecule binding domain-containing protein n=1 Tax=Nocardioides marinisabuli TaxID=419476 RepID=A0A7Y9JRZ4_9ACTN|nr:GyrI-like domain-containing protein [Nocardioides marinisabuli]NYD59005.1 hypothetical protein [Nocardioides marinisabuli]
MDKVDLKRTIATYRAPRGRFEVVDVATATYLAVDGHGDPNTSADFTGAVAALYPVAYRTKFASKRDLGRDYVVPPLEGLWWADDMASFTSRRDKARWHWTLLLVLPDWIDEALVDAALQQVGAGDRPERLDDVRLETLSEGRCVQTLHVGPFDEEAEVLERMHADIAERGLRMTGRHHEIYLSDRRRTAPERQRTILRQPVRPA